MGLFRRQEKIYSQDDLDKEVQTALEQQGFDFSQLWVEPESSGGLMKFVPMINLILLIVTIALIAFKK